MPRIENVSPETEGTFFRCLHDERPDDPEVMRIRRDWYEKHLPLGLRAKVLLTDRDEVAGLCQYIPIQHSHYLGSDLMAILCMWVHGYSHHLGNRQGQGYGTMLLEAVEEDAEGSGFRGVAAWGKDYPYWNPVSFYEHFGYVRADQAGSDVLVWKSFHGEGEPPRFLRQKKSGPILPDRVTVVSFFTGWCGGCSFNLEARAAAAELEEIVNYIEVDTSDRDRMLDWGISDGILMDGQPYRNDGPPFTREDLKRDILDLHGKKTGQRRTGSMEDHE
jgi:GNAT superfamily N-acetyltransferase